MSRTRWSTTTMAGNGGGKTGAEQFGKSGLFKGSDLATIRKFGSEEAEHVTALTGFVKQEPAPEAFDPALPEAKVLKAVEPFIQ
jgi:hypothetical protein